MNGLTDSDLHALKMSESKLEKRKSYIYRIKCEPTKKIYIGRTINLNERSKIHFTNKERHNYNSDLEKYGEGAFTFEVLYECDDMLTSVIIEEYLIRKYSITGMCYNRAIKTTGNCERAWELKNKYGLQMIKKILYLYKHNETDFNPENPERECRYCRNEYSCWIRELMMRGIDANKQFLSECGIQMINRAINKRCDFYA